MSEAERELVERLRGACERALLYLDGVPDDDVPPREDVVVELARVIRYVDDLLCVPRDVPGQERWF